MKKIHQTIAVAFVAGFLAGCQATKPAELVTAAGVGRVAQAIPAQVVTVRAVTIATDLQTGMTAGMLAGAAMGSKAGKSKTANAASTITGAIVGALAGAGIEQTVTPDAQGLEYVLQTGESTFITVIQGANPAFAPNDRVMVVHGATARIIADKRVLSH